MERDLARIVGSDFVLPGDDPVLTADQTAFGAVRGVADAVVRPADAEQVAALVAWCHERGVAVIPRGGGTGWAGGAVPQGSGVVVTLDRLNRVRALDPLQWRMQVDAGVTTHTVRRLARENGLCFPPDPGAAEQSQIGGNIATNAGGPHCFKYGVTGAWVTGLEAVVAPGELLRVGGPVRKDVAGYDLRGLLIGSEGTLGIVTSAWLRLMPAPPVALPVAAFYADAAAGAEAVTRLMAAGPIPSVIEVLDGGTLRAAGAGFPGAVPDGAGLLVLTEADTSAADRDALAEALAPDAIGGPVIPDDAAALWRWRDGIGLAVAVPRGGKLSEDITVPLDRLAEAIERVVSIGAAHGLEACSWGHAGDGNLHATLLLDPADPGEVARAWRAADDVLSLAIELGGTISGEHGIGLLKRGRLRDQWPAASVTAHRAIKTALDPKGIFNPGKKEA